MSEDILVIGGTGFIGTHVCNHLNDAGHNVTAGSPNGEETTKLNSDVETEMVDILYHGSLNFEEYGVVINLAGLSPLFEPSGVTYEEIHLEGVENIVDEAERADIKQFVHMSAYGANPEAETEYLRTKGEGQELVIDSRIESCVFRPSIVLGHGGELDSFLRGMRNLPVVLLPGNPCFQPIAVTDVADIFVSAVENRPQGVYDIGGDEVLSMKELVKRMYPKKRVVVIPDRISRTSLQVAEYLPLPAGIDQYRSLQMDNSLENNDARDFLEDFRPFSV